MPTLFSSPRKRRQAVWVAGLLAVAGLAGGLIAIVPNTTPGSGKPTKDEGPAQLANNKTFSLKKADRLAIDALLAKFVPAAVERKDAALAWSLAGPELKAASTLAQWKKGESPVPAFPVRETTFTGWPTVEVERNAVVFNLLVHPTKGHEDMGDYTFAVQTIRRHGKWLVNRLYTIAINRKPKGGLREVGPADFGAQGTGRAPPTKNPTLGQSWFLPVLFGLIAALGAPFLVGGFLFVRNLRRRRRRAREQLSTLPPTLRSP